MREMSRMTMVAACAQETPPPLSSALSGLRVTAVVTVSPPKHLEGYAAKTLRIDAALPACPYASTPAFAGQAAAS